MSTETTIQDFQFFYNNAYMYNKKTCECWQAVPFVERGQGNSCTECDNQYCNNFTRREKTALRCNIENWKCMSNDRDDQYDAIIWKRCDSVSIFEKIKTMLNVPIQSEEDLQILSMIL